MRISREKSCFRNQFLDTKQAGDSLEGIALQVYGDSSLWYVIADANGLSEKGSRAGDGCSMQVGRRLIIPSVSTGQHHTGSTHKVLNANQVIGNTSATAPLPLIPPETPKKHNGAFAKLVVGVVAVVAMVLTAGVLELVATGALFAGLGRC